MCKDFVQGKKGNISIKEFKGNNNNALLICKTCGKCFSETSGTPFFGLKSTIDELARVLSLIPKMGSIRAVARYTDHKPDTIIKWIKLTSNNKEVINEYFGTYYHYNRAQIEEVWSKIEERKRIKQV
jgi:hypothetical protein